VILVPPGDSMLLLKILIVFLAVIIPVKSESSDAWNKQSYGAINNRIAEVLQLQMGSGDVTISEVAKDHIWQKHKADYSVCMKNMQSALSKPDYVGMNLRHPHNFSIVEELDGGRFILLAISLKPDSEGDFRVKTCYSINSGKAERLITSGEVAATELWD